MRFHKEGYTSLALCILFIFVINAFLQFYLPQYHTLKWIVYILSFLFFIAVVFFFRDPAVDIVSDENAILSPADGKITAIEEVDEPGFITGRGIKISIAPSPLNVHTNRNPVSGTIIQINSEEHVIVVENATGTTVVYRQIPGFTKHVIANVKQGDTVDQGAKFGFGMLGSSVDVFLPIGTKTDVDVDDVVIGGQTILARLK